MTCDQKLFNIVNNCFFLPKWIYVTQDKYNDRKQVLMKVSLQQGMTSTIEATTQALLWNDLEPEQNKLMGASIDSKPNSWVQALTQKFSNLTEESKRHLQSFEDKLEENTNKCLKRIIIASLSNKPMELASKNREGPTRGAPPKKSRGTDNHQIPTINRLQNQEGQVGGRGHGRGLNQAPARALTFNMSRTQAIDSLNHYFPQQQQNRTNQDVITINNEPESSTNGWEQRRSTSNNIPPSSLNDGLGR